MSENIRKQHTRVFRLVSKLITSNSVPKGVCRKEDKVIYKIYLKYKMISI